MQEGYASRPRGMSRESMEYERLKETSEGDENKVECYRQCVEDAWDLRHESICKSVCNE